MTLSGSCRASARTSHKRSRLTAILTALLSLAALPAAGAADDAQVVAQKVYDRDDGRDSYAKVKMALIDRSGSRRERDLEIAVKDYGALSKRYIYFSAPEAIKGTAFLASENEDREDDQFLYLPALGRVRRIVSGQKDRSFVNTDYTYEDLERHKVTDYTHRILGREPFLGKQCTVLESRPKSPDQSQYGRTVSWVTQESFVPIKVEFFDKKDRRVKLFTAGELKQIEGIWTVTSSLMQELDSGHKTEMRLVEIRYNQALSDELFAQRQLEHRR